MRENKIGKTMTILMKILAPTIEEDLLLMWDERYKQIFGEDLHQATKP